MTTRLIPVTDTGGRMLLDDDETDEPLPGSIILTSGHHGTAWQRQFSDGLWHRVGGGRAIDWPEMCSRRNVVLVYDAPERTGS